MTNRLRILLVDIDKTTDPTDLSCILSLLKSKLEKLTIEKIGHIDEPEIASFQTDSEVVSAPPSGVANFMPEEVSKKHFKRIIAEIDELNHIEYISCALFFTQTRVDMHSLEKLKQLGFVKPVKTNLPKEDISLHQTTTKKIISGAELILDASSIFDNSEN
jgi:hypothetical protein